MFRKMMMIAVAAVLCTVAVAQAAAPQMGGMAGMDASKKPASPAAKAEVKLGGAAISVDYSAPSARGRAIFGGLVPYGQVWRTGANAATTLKTSADLEIGDLKVPAGTYTLYTLPTESGWQLIINKQTGQWGTVYDEKQDLGRVPLKVGKTAAPVETFVIDFQKTMGKKTQMHLKWVGVDASVEVEAK